MHEPVDIEVSLNYLSLLKCHCSLIFIDSSPDSSESDDLHDYDPMSRQLRGDTAERQLGTDNVKRQVGGKGGGKGAICEFTLRTVGFVLQ